MVVIHSLCAGRGVFGMMGRQASDQGPLFHAYDLEAVVPADHLLRGIDVFLDLSDLRRHPASFYSHTGRPSVDPELMMRMLIVGYSFGIRSERSCKMRPEGVELVRPRSSGNTFA